MVTCYAGFADDVLAENEDIIELSTNRMAHILQRATTFAKCVKMGETETFNVPNTRREKKLKQ